MLTLRALPPGDGLPSQSPFVIKIMGYLHLLGLDWQADFSADIRKQPHGKLPVLMDGERVIADSEAIAHYLEARAGRRLNHGLSAEQEAISLALTRLAEEHLYFLVVWNRWAEPGNFAGLRPGLRRIAPFPMSLILPGLIRRGVLKQVRAQGIGRMSDALRQEKAAADLGVLAQILGDGPWLLGVHPRAVDLAVAPMLAVLAASPADTGIRREFLARPALVDYTRRALADLFPAPDAIRRAR